MASCKFCGETELKWYGGPGCWALMDGLGKRHRCADRAADPQTGSPMWACKPDDNGQWAIIQLASCDNDVTLLQVEFEAATMRLYGTLPNMMHHLARLLIADKVSPELCRRGGMVVVPGDGEQEEPAALPLSRRPPFGRALWA